MKAEQMGCSISNIKFKTLTFFQQMIGLKFSLIFIYLLSKFDYIERETMLPKLYTYIQDCVFYQEFRLLFIGITVDRAHANNGTVVIASLESLPSTCL